MDVVKLAVGLFRPKYIPVVLGKIFEITGRRLDAFGLRIMGPTAPSEKCIQCWFKNFFIQVFINFLVSTHRRLVHIQNQRATLGESLFIAPSATVVGPVSIDDATAVMYGVVIRGKVSLPRRVQGHTSF